MNLPALRQQLIKDEALRLKPYLDTVGKWTVGVGRNLTDRGVTETEAMFLLDNDVRLVADELDDKLPWWRTLDDERQNILANMCFNMGIGRLQGFKLMLAALRAGNRDEAARQMLDSEWARQVGDRAERLAAAMRGV